MVVQHNLQAMNANRMLNVTTGNQSKSTEKLSSGYKINRAADDAAGLSISEKMRKQIRGLDQASSNAQDGVSAVQTAEGALTEVHSMLQRMNELAVQAANGTNSESDRQSIQDEIDQLTTEIDRVAETTKFNETYLLKGNAEGTTSKVNVNAHDAGLAGKLTDKGNGTATFELDKALKDGDKVTIAGKNYTIGAVGKGSVTDPSSLNTKTDGYDVATADASFKDAALSAGDSVTYDGKTYTATDKVALGDVTFGNNDTFTVGGVTFTVATGSAEAAITGKTGTIGADKVDDYINAALADGKQVTATKFNIDVSTGGAAKADTAVTGTYQVVSSLADGEVSLAQTDANKALELVAAATGANETAAGHGFKAGDSVTVSGVKTVATEAPPVSAKDTYNSIKALAEDGTDKVTIGTGVDAKEYTIVGEADEDVSAFKVTKDTIMSMIKDGNTVNVDGGGAKTVIGDLGFNPTTGDVITSNDAYKLMAKELEAASSIGTDVAAKVTNEGNGKFTIKQGTVEVTEKLNFSLHVGADNDMSNKINVDIETMSSANLGIQGINVSDDTGVEATYAIDAIADALTKVSQQRSALGAIQNRLEHSIANLDNVVENTTAAESRIRDTDMAEEMVEYSKNNILAQAGQSMLAQANQSTQGVMSLLQ